MAIITLTNGYAHDQLNLNNRAYADGQHLVSVFVDGQKRVVATTAPNVGAALSQLNVAIGTGDVVEPATDTAINQPIFNVNVYRALPATISDDGKITHVLTGYQSARQIATAAGITTYPEDIVTLGRVDNFSIDRSVGRQVMITRAKPIQVVLAGKVYNFRTQKTTAAELFSEHGLTVEPKDLVNIDLNALLSGGQRIVVNRLTQTIVQLQQPIPVTTSYEYDANQLLGYSAVKQAGSDGSKLVSYLVNLKDGNETDRHVLDEKITQPATNRIIVKGSKVPIPVGAGPVQDMIIHWANYYGVNENQLLRVARCESNFNPNASNGSHFGVFQFLASTYAANYAKAGASSNYWDADSNVRTAAYMFSIGQAGQWACK